MTRPLHELISILADFAEEHGGNELAREARESMGLPVIRSMASHEGMAIAVDTFGKLWVLGVNSEMQTIRTSEEEICPPYQWERLRVINESLENEEPRRHAEERQDDELPF